MRLAEELRRRPLPAVSVFRFTEEIARHGCAAEALLSTVKKRAPHLACEARYLRTRS